MQDPFREAEQRYWWYTNETKAGRLDDGAYRAALNEVRVTDAQGRLWMMQEGSGQWHVWQGNMWTPSTPYAPAPPAADPDESGGGGFLGKLLLYSIGIVLFWTVVGLVLRQFGGAEGRDLLLAMSGAAGLTILITGVRLFSRWEGRVVDIRRERVRVDDEDGHHYEQHNFAYILEPSGNTRKMQAQKDWEVGDYLQKRRGESKVRRSR